MRVFLLGCTPTDFFEIRIEKKVIIMINIETYFKAIPREKLEMMLKMMGIVDFIHGVDRIIFEKAIEEIELDTSTNMNEKYEHIKSLINIVYDNNSVFEEYDYPADEFNTNICDIAVSLYENDDVLFSYNDHKTDVDVGVRIGIFTKTQGLNTYKFTSDILKDYFMNSKQQ